MKLALSICTVLQFAYLAQAQSVDWTTSMSCGYGKSTYALSGLRFRDAYYIATDARCQSFTIQGHRYCLASLSKVSSTGDSVFLKKLDRFGIIYAFSFNPDQLIKAFAIVENYSPIYERTQLLTLDTNANILQVDTLFNLPFEVSVPYKSILGRDGSTIVVGFLRKSSSNDFWFLRIPYGESPPNAGLTYNPGHPNSVAYNVEQLPNGNYLISGIVGSRIASYEVDSLGQNGVYHEWWQHPNFNNIYQATVTRIGKNRRLVQGTISGSGGEYTGIHEADGTKIWGHIGPGSCLASYANQDSTFVLYHKIQASWPLQSYDFFLRKYRFDSTLVWSLQLDPYLGNLPSGSIGFTLNDIVYNNDSTESALLVGSVDQGTEPMLCLKISGIGIPATEVEDAQNRGVNQVVLYPNPTEGIVHIKSGTSGQITTVTLLNTIGQQLNLLPYIFDNQLNLSSFPSGIYLIKIDFSSGKSENHRIVLRR